ncbi:CMRF35-like molecule 5 isoform X1 [Gymnodraco acuticeps]|uniref:CMRF35-like molecule 5 isoform X1 n=1 Tax=Gymnodraco acuticeps TaxID=8218 RepID=A0A6P8T5H2_GYMAC|nr:CMRF35-like molecule 5 isoform X1 [Gymnodraco acuticeps]
MFFIFTMINIFAYSCLLSALSFVEMKILSIRGCVGERVTFKCSDWNTVLDARSYDKYFCRRPCTERKHIIIKAASGKTTQGNRIQIFNRGNNLFVTFTNLKKSDADTYYCRVKRIGPDPWIKVVLKVTDAASYGPTPETVDTFTTLPPAVSNSSTLPSNSSDNITDVSASNTTLNTPTPSAPATQAAGSVPYLIAGLIFTFALVMVVLLLTRKLMKRGRRGLDVSSPHEDIYNSARPDEVYQSLHPLTMDEDQVYSSLTEGSALHTTLDDHCSRK